MLIYRENQAVVMSHNGEVIFRKQCKTRRGSEKAYKKLAKALGLKKPYFGK